MRECLLPLSVSDLEYVKHLLEHEALPQLKQLIGEKADKQLVTLDKTAQQILLANEADLTQLRLKAQNIDGINKGIQVVLNMLRPEHIQALIDVAKEARNDE